MKNYKFGQLLYFASIALPCFCFNSHHDCHYDKCMHIYDNEDRGMCIYDAIDTLCMAIIIGMYISIIGGILILSKDKNAISPFVVIVLFFALALFVAIVDPAKWLFCISLLPMLIGFIIAATIDSRNK